MDHASPVKLNSPPVRIQFTPSRREHVIMQDTHAQLDLTKSARFVKLNVH